MQENAGALEDTLDVMHVWGDDSVTLDKIEVLWLALDSEWGATAPGPGSLAGLPFALRKRILLARRHLRVDLAYIDAVTRAARLVGFCVASVEGATAYIEALYVVPELRGHHIGGKLLGDALDWINAKHPAMRHAVLPAPPPPGATAAAQLLAELDASPPRHQAASGASDDQSASHGTAVQPHPSFAAIMAGASGFYKRFGFGEPFATLLSAGPAPGAMAASAPGTLHG